MIIGKPLFGFFYMSKVKSFPKKFLTYILKHKILSAVGIVIIVAAIFFLRPKPAKPIPTETVKKQDLVQSISITGTINAEKSVDLNFLTGGLLTYLGVQKGDTVSQYQTIATLDQRTVLKNLQNALTDYSKQRNTFDQYNLDQQAIKPEDAVNDRLKRALQNNQYDLNKTIVSVELQDIARQQSILSSPIAGIVTRADAKTAGVNIAATTTFTVVDPNSLTFKMEVDEADISKVKQGQEVEVVLDSFPDKTLHLTVDSIDFVTHTTSTGGNAYDVKAKLIQNNDYRVGMNGNAQIITSKKPDVVTVSLSSLFDTNKVYVKVNNKYEKRTLKLGLQNDTSTEVLEGLNEGETVVTDPTLVPKK